MLRLSVCVRYGQRSARDVVSLPLRRLISDAAMQEECAPIHQESGGCGEAERGQAEDSTGPKNMAVQTLRMLAACSGPVSSRIASHS